MSDARRQLRRIETALRLHDRGKVNWAYAHYLKILERDPFVLQILCNTAGIEIERGAYAKAEARYRLALEYYPESPVAVSGLCLCLHHRHAPQEARAVSAALLERAPDDPQAYYTHAMTLSRDGDTQTALRVVDEGLRHCAPHQKRNKPRTDLLKARGLLRIAEGDYAGGFRDRAYFALFGHAEATATYPLDLAAFQGKTVLIHPEEGNGDGVALGRFIQPFAESGARLSVACRPAMRRMMESLSDIADLVPEPKTYDGYDHVLPPIALPHILGTKPGTLPAPMTLAIPADSLARGAAFAAPYADRLKVGFCWSGSTGYADNAHRSARLDPFLKLAQTAGTQFFSLYKGPLLTDLFSHAQRDRVIDTSSDDRDYADAAGTIAAMDLVITTDTCVAHIAGSLGTETWLLLHRAPYYYYPRHQEDRTIWYPSMRLFRQDKAGDWDTVFAAVQAALTERSAKHG
ncbi:hypothetical protein FHS89_001932 [Rubricella aquisinus]|uniref:Tetratricopeptide repeat protein n=1 Tax=Rubricella aquisinus TaxID=2028108 RepID=A0A840WQG3_9RHOB|nr:hypothetical protein [Rubricella aquisinus]